MTPQQLKASILKYAMQGKLVEQKPEDGTGEDLFCKIQQVSKPNKNVTPIVEEEIPFDIPSSWKWCKFGELVDCSMGKTPPRAEPVWWQNDIHWVSISDMKDYGHISYTKEMVSQKALEEKFGGIRIFLQKCCFCRDRGYIKLFIPKNCFLLNSRKIFAILL